MATYSEVSNNISERLAIAISNVVAEKYPTARLEQEHKALVAGLNSLQQVYLSSVVGRKEYSPLMSNVIGSFCGWWINQEGVFERAGFATTQRQAYLISRDHIAFNRLLNAAWEDKSVKNYVARADAWVTNMQSELAVKRQALDTMPVFTESEVEFYRVITSWDIYYDYADDRNAYRAGSTRHKEIKAFIAETISVNPAMRRIVEFTAKAYGFNVGFFM
jgi:hypothetical protein